MGEVLAEPGTRLLLIRHGETQWNADQRVQGHLDVPLSAQGVEQSRRLAAWLADEPLDAVYTSDLQRAHVTAEVVTAARRPVWPDARFREARFGGFEGLTAAECAASFPEEYAAWRADAVRNRPPGGETLEDLRDRCMEALREHLPKHPRQTVAVFAHGGPIRAMVCGVLGFSLEIYPKLRVENTSIARILFTERGPILAALNETGHLKASAAAPGHVGWEER
jgi:broad specificity phosphatase PhoE